MSHKIAGEGSSPHEPRPADESLKSKGKVVGRDVKWEMKDKKKFAGLVILVLAALALIAGFVLASGVGGGGIKAYIGAGLVVTALIGSVVSICLFKAKHDPTAVRETRTGEYAPKES